MFQSRMYRPIIQQSIRSYSSQVSTKRAAIERIIRVDHAGELGADRIYAGQMAVLGKTSIGPVIQHMWDQEKAHKAKFEELIPQYRVRPTVLVPFWNVAGYVLGAGTVGEQLSCTASTDYYVTTRYNLLRRY
ncbi:unnamed protein product [Meganyctiphanes norvegica]|uniref:Ubiquinone biosynthesis protein COQ7 n=1 Tax=Meganyctiphanes norvegica TaxID=48144 RepID=A0AAV2QI72_MEGNR